MKLIILHAACGARVASGRDVSGVDVYSGCAGSRQGGSPDGHRDEVQTQVGVGGWGWGGVALEIRHSDRRP